MDSWDHLDIVIRDLPTADSPDWDGLTMRQRWLVAMNAIEGQVTNGGFHAVYYNNYQHYLPLAAAGYEAVGAVPQAEIVRNVLATVGRDPWSGPPEIWPDPRAAEPPTGSGDIGVFDEPWYALDLNVLSRLKLRYIEKYPAEFPKM